MISGFVNKIHMFKGHVVLLAELNLRGVLIKSPQNLMQAKGARDFITDLPSEHIITRTHCDIKSRV